MVKAKPTKLERSFDKLYNQKWCVDSLYHKLIFLHGSTFCRKCRVEADRFSSPFCNFIDSNWPYAYGEQFWVLRRGRYG